MAGTPHKRVSLRGSALFRITSPARLARILCISPDMLNYLVDHAAENYCVRPDRKTGRTIEEPKAMLKRVQARVSWLIGQIETPDYLHSGIKKRSYVTNASSHAADECGIKLDVKKFFPSIRAAAVCHFFADVLEYPMDVASRMTKLLTIDGHVPTGGNASCILSFWAYKPMFDEIAELASSRGCRFTLYVDDMAITGRFATRKMQQEARKIIGRYRLRAHKSKVFAPRQPRVVTGVAITPRGRELPNRRARVIADMYADLGVTATDAERLEILPKLVSRLSEAAVIDPAWEQRKSNAINMRRSIRARAKVPF